MKLSIITICYNNEHDIRPTIESVLEQTYQDIEYIVVDGASKDGSLNIIREYEDRIARIISEPDGGLYEAINKGFRAATGDVIGMIHAGDRLHDCRVIEKIAKFHKENDIDISYGYSKIVDAKGNVKRVNCSPKYYRWLLRYGWMPSHQSIYCRRGLLEKYGFYRQEIGSYADYEWVVRYFYKYGQELKIKRIPEYIVKFTLGGQSTTNIKKQVGRKKRQVLRQCWTENGYRAPFAISYWKFAWKVPQMLMAFLYK